MSDYTFNVAKFRADFPAFGSDTVYPDATLQMYWANAICYLSPTNYGYLAGACRERALYLMTAHLATLSTMIDKGKTPVMVQSSGVDKVNVSLTPPEMHNQWQWWLNLTGYGQQLLALLQITSAGGFLIGGRPERAAFRKVGGYF